MYECARCRGKFGGLTVFDAHHAVSYDRPHGEEVRCRDLAAVTGHDGQPKWRQNARGVWRAATANPFTNSTSEGPE